MVEMSHKNHNPRILPAVGGWLRLLNDLLESWCSIVKLNHWWGSWLIHHFARRRIWLIKCLLRLYCWSIHRRYLCYWSSCVASTRQKLLHLSD
uniref:Uncharacterized protein n=1 Tax=Anopheles albimanus TaxID=7167 RepID=A0A182FX58_ANOAL